MAQFKIEPIDADDDDQDSAPDSGDDSSPDDLSSLLAGVSGPSSDVDDGDANESPDSGEASSDASSIGSIADIAAALNPKADSDSISTSAASPNSGSDSTQPKGSMNPVLQAYLDNKIALQAAQQKAQQNQTNDRLFAGLGQIGHGLSRAPGQADESGLASQLKADNAPVDNYLNQLASSKEAAQLAQMQSGSDPNSDEANQLRQLYKPMFAKSGLDPTSLDGLGADQIKEYAQNPLEFQAKMQNIAATKQLAAETSRQNAQLKSDTLKTSQAQASQARQDKLDAAQSAADEKTQAAISKDLNSLTASSRNALGTATKAKISVNRLQQIVNDPNATNQDLQSAYADMNAVIAGTATQGGTEHQAYNTLANDLAKYQQYWTSNPTAPVIPEVKQHVMDVAKKMSAISDGVINQNTRQVAAGRSGWISRHPDDWKDMVAAATQAPDQGPAPAAAGGAIPPHPQDSEAVQWARSNPNDPRAKQILQLNGGSSGL